MRTWEVPKR